MFEALYEYCHLTLIYDVCSPPMISFLYKGSLHFIVNVSHGERWNLERIEGFGLYRNPGTLVCFAATFALPPEMPVLFHCGMSHVNAFRYRPQDELLKDAESGSRCRGVKVPP